MIPNMTFRKLAAFLLVFICSYTLAQKPASTRGGEPAAAKSKPAQKTESAKKDSTAPKEKDSKDTKEGESADPMSSGTFNGLKLRSVGPALISGRVVSITVNTQNKSQYFIGAASSGVWRTDNDGTTFVPVFEHEGSYSMGTVVIDPKHPNVVWVGTGEQNSQRSRSYGDAVYRSEDSAKTWKNMGLKRTDHIPRLLLYPPDSTTTYAAPHTPPSRPRPH